MDGRFLRVLALLPLAGCITMPAYVPLDAGVQQSLRDVKVLSVIHQDEIVLAAASPGVTAAAGGGLLAALVESEIARSRQQDIQSTIEPFYAAIDDVDFRRTFWSTVLPELERIHPGKTFDITKTASVIPSLERSKIPAGLPAGKAQVYMDTRYTFTADFSRLNVVTTIDLWRGGQQDPAYSNVFTYQSAAVGASGTGAIALWGKDGGSRYRALLGEGITETARMLRLDAEYPGAKGAEQKPPAGKRSIEARKAGPEGPAVSGPALDEQPARVVVRNADGRLYSLPR